MSRSPISILSVLFVLFIFTPAALTNVSAAQGLGFQSESIPGAAVFSGAATYSVPVSVLPGRNGIAPNISLSYSSFSSNGWMGMGWDLDLRSGQADSQGSMGPGFSGDGWVGQEGILSVPAISRSTKHGLDYTAQDFFAGTQELAPWTELGDGFFRNKKESAFSKYYFDAAANTWEVTAKSGARFFYGASFASRLGKDTDNTFIWFLERVEDTNGNYFIIQYTQDQGQVYLNAIEYTGHNYNNGTPGFSPSNRVEFELENRPDPQVSYVSGKKVTTTKRLSAIKTYNKDDDLYTAYYLTYEDNALMNFSRLESIQRFGSDNSSAMPPIELTWHDNGQISFDTPTTTSIPGGTEVGYLRSGDLNGDGKDDIIRHDDQGVVYTALSLGDGTFGSVKTISGDGGQGAGFITLADINADGKTDIIKHTATGTVYYAFSTGDGYFSAPIQHDGSGGAGEWLVAAADINGDGAEDLIKSDAAGSVYVYLFDKTYNAFSSSNTQLSGSGGGAAKEFFIDMNDDNRTDLVLMDDSNNINIYLANSEKSGIDGFETTPTTFNAADINPGFIQFADVNADHLPDLITHSSSGIASVYLNNGNNSFDSTAITHTGSGGTTFNSVHLDDINNDGFDDLIKEDAAGTLFIYLATGDGHFEASHAYSQAKAAPSVQKGIHFTDITGDGVTDLIQETGTSIVYTTQAKDFRSSSLLKTTRVQNAASITMEYTPSTQFSHTLLPIKMFLVTSRTINDGLDNLSTESYAYEEGLYDYEAHEFRGFGLVTKILPDETVLKTWFHQDEFRQGMAYETRFFEKDETALLSKTFKDYQTQSLDSPDDTIMWVKLALARTENYDDKTTFTQKEYSYDDFGNPIQIFTSGGTLNANSNAQSLTTDIEYTQYGEWIWRKTKDTFTGSVSGKTRETAYNHDTLGNLITQTPWLETGTDPIITYTYDEYGHKTTITNAMGKTTTIVYDTQTQTFPIQVIKPDTTWTDGTDSVEINHITSTDWNYLYGTPATTTDENNQTTKYTYDAFGRIKITDLADGGQSVINYYDYTIPRRVVTQVLEDTGHGLVDVSYQYFDGLGRPVQSVSNGENQFVVQRIYYNEMGQAYLVKGPFFSPSSSWGQEPSGESPWKQTAFDDFGRPTLITTPTENADTPAETLIHYSGFTTTFYDPDTGRKDQIKDYLGRIKTILQYSDTETIQTQYEYNAANNIEKIINHYGQVTTTIFDSLGRRLSHDDPDMGKWTYTWNANGKPTSQNDSKNQVVNFTYDALDRLLTKQYFDSNGQPSDATTTYIYDNPNAGGELYESDHGIGRVFSIRKGNTEIRYDAYDAMGRELAVVKIIGTGNYTTLKQFDLSGKLINLTYPDGEFVEYEYIPGTNLFYNALVSDDTTQAWFTNYEPTGKPGEVYYGNDAFTTYTYHPQSTRLTKILSYDSLANSIQDRTYTYSKAGDIRKVIDNFNNITHDYNYDRIHRLTSEVISSQSIPVADVSVLDYKYKQAASDPFHGVAAIEQNGQQVDFNYDANGNMITSPDIKDPASASRAITYDTDNMPITIIKGENTVNFTYDGYGTRVAKTTNTSGITHYIGKHYEIRDGTPIKYIFAGNLRVAMIKNGTATYFHKDHLGSSTVLTDESGLLVDNQSADYMPFGGTRGDTDITATAYKFTDQEFDTEIDLYNYNARLYDPILGMFITADTLVPNIYDSQSLNRYAYCLNNPLIYTDPDGHVFVAAPGVIGALFGMVTNAYDNYDAYKSGQISGLQYSSTIARGGVFGFAAAYMGPLGAISLGTINSFANKEAQDKEITGMDLVTEPIKQTIGVFTGLKFKSPNMIPELTKRSLEFNFTDHQAVDLSQYDFEGLANDLYDASGVNFEGKEEYNFSSPYGLKPGDIDMSAYSDFGPDPDAPDSPGANAAGSDPGNYGGDSGMGMGNGGGECSY